MPSIIGIDIVKQQQQHGSQHNEHSLTGPTFHNVAGLGMTDEVVEFFDEHWTYSAKQLGQFSVTCVLSYKHVQQCKSGHTAEPSYLTFCNVGKSCRCT